MFNEKKINDKKNIYVNLTLKKNDFIQSKYLEDITIKKFFEKDFLSFAKSVCQRTIPDVWDGLKPVQRWIIFSMFNDRLFYNMSFRKSSGTVGSVISKYHPHGNLAIYSALVKLVQNFHLLHPLIKGQGNFGSIDDPTEYAAEWYTEAKLSKIAHLLVDDLWFDTVHMIKTYDNRSYEPVYLPSSLPNLFLNGTLGIGVSIMSSIPSHNLKELYTALIYLIDCKLNNVSPKFSWIWEVVIGPDFATGCNVERVNLNQIYRTGKGTIFLQAGLNVQKNENGDECIIINSLPINVHKSFIRKQLIELVYVKKSLFEIKKVSDESELNVRIVLTLKKGVNASIVKCKLLKLTSLRQHLFVIILANFKGKPKVYNLMSYLKTFLKFTLQMKMKKMMYLKKIYDEKILLIQAYLVVYKYSKEIINIIKNNNKKDIYARLKNDYKLTLYQINHILSITIRKLQKIESIKYLKEFQSVKIKLQNVTKILSNWWELLKYIRKLFIKIIEDYQVPWKTTIVDTIKRFDEETLIDNKCYIVVLTDKNYILKRSIDLFKVQKLKGKGKNIDDLIRWFGIIKSMLVIRELEEVIIISSFGWALRLKSYKLNQTYLNLNDLTLPDEWIISMIRPGDVKKYDSLIIVTSLGYVLYKSNNLSADYKKFKYICRLWNNDKIQGVWLLNYPSKEKICYVYAISAIGKMIAIDIHTIWWYKGQGYGIKLMNQLKIISSGIILHRTLSWHDYCLLLVTKKGFCKKISLTIKKRSKKGFYIKVQWRGGIGKYIIKLKKDDRLCFSSLINIWSINYHIAIITNWSHLIILDVKDVTLRKTSYSNGLQILSKDIMIHSCVMYKINETI